MRADGSTTLQPQQLGWTSRSEACPVLVAQVQPQQLGWTSRSKAMLRACGTGASMGPWDIFLRSYAIRLGTKTSMLWGSEAEAQFVRAHKKDSEYRSKRRMASVKGELLSSTFVLEISFATSYWASQYLTQQESFLGSQFDKIMLAVSIRPESGDKCFIHLITLQWKRSSTFDHVHSA